MRDINNPSTKLTKHIENFIPTYPKKEFLEFFLNLKKDNKKKSYLRLMVYIQDGEVKIAYAINDILDKINMTLELKELNHSTVWEKHIVKNVLRTEQIRNINSCEISTIYKCTGDIIIVANKIHFENLIRTPYSRI